MSELKRFKYHLCERWANDPTHNRIGLYEPDGRRYYLEMEGDKCYKVYDDKSRVLVEHTPEEEEDFKRFMERLHNGETITPENINEK